MDAKQVIDNLACYINDPNSNEGKSAYFALRAELDNYADETTKIKDGKAIWRRYLDSVFIEKGKVQQRTSKHRFSDDEAFQILWNRYVNQLHLDVLVEMYNSNKQTIADIIKRRQYTWIDVSEIVRVSGISEDEMKTKRFIF